MSVSNVAEHCYPKVNEYASAPGSRNVISNRLLTDEVVLAHEVVQAARLEQAVPVLVDVDAV